jgi:hypothetical protein
MRCLATCLIPAAALILAGCTPEPKPTVFETKHGEHKHDDPNHVHERDKMMLADYGPHHAGLTAHLSEKEGNELDVLFETVDKKDPKPLPLSLTKFTGRATRAGDDKVYTLEFEPAPKDERKDDPDGKCSHFSAKAPWMKPEDVLSVTVTTEIDKKETKAIWIDFVPKKFNHAE